MNFPNILTLARLGMVPVLVLLWYLPFPGHRWACAGLFALAALTDFFDGYLARKNGLETPFGAFLDPVADKVMVAVALGLLIEHWDKALMTLPAVVIICREVLVSALREWMAEMGARGVVKVSWVGKLKTAMQMIAIGWLLAFPSDQGILAQVGLGILVVAAILTLHSLVQYLRAAWPYLMGTNSP